MQKIAHIPHHVQEDKILYAGLAPSPLGDQSHQIIIQTGENLGISILGPCKRIDSLYGLPNVEDAEFHKGVEATLKRLLSGDGEYVIAPIRLVAPSNTQPGDTVGRGKTPPFRIIRYQGFPDMYKHISASEVVAHMQQMVKLGNSGVTKEKLKEHTTANVCGFIQQNPQVFYIEVHSGWKQANPSPLTDPGGVIWSYCAPAFIGECSNPKISATHIYGMFFYDKNWDDKGEQGLGWIAVSKGGIVCEQSHYQEVPVSFLEQIRMYHTIPREFDAFHTKAKTYRSFKLQKSKV